MLNFNCINLSNSELASDPFRHFCSTGVLRDEMARRVFEWLENTTEWGLTETDFYKQYEFCLLKAQLPEKVRSLICNDTISYITNNFRKIFDITNLDLVGIAAHKLIEGHRIGLHNDYINGEETHRLTLQINPHWKASNGGFLMLFKTEEAEDVSKIVQPLDNSAFGFEISSGSYHAVSTVYNFSRYTIVYTFKKK